MTDPELREFLSMNSWSIEDRQKLVEEWNERRSDLGQIGLNNVRTSCRLRNIVSSFMNFLNENKAVNS